MPHKTESIQIPHGQICLAGRLSLPAKQPKALVLVSHGLSSSMASNKLSTFSSLLAENGFAALQFDHTGCGDSFGEERLTTLTKRRDEVISAVKAFEKIFPDLPMAYMGSSLGAVAVILASLEKAPFCLLAWSGPTDMKALFNRLIKQDPVPDFPDMADDIQKYDLKKALSQIKGVFFVHGESDEVVPCKQAQQGFDQAIKPKKLLILPKADHRLSNLQDQRKAMEQSLLWLKKHIPQA